jgi:hypothetical protein
MLNIGLNVSINGKKISNEPLHIFSTRIIKKSMNKKEQNNLHYEQTQTNMNNITGVSASKFELIPKPKSDSNTSDSTISLIDDGLFSEIYKNQSILIEKGKFIFKSKFFLMIKAKELVRLKV